MNEERQIERILDKAKLFKSRANKSPEDGKRHDLIEPDERKYMRIAYDKLGWSYAKIGTVFERDPRVVAKIVSEPSKGKDERSEQNEKLSADTNTQPGPTMTEENKHEPLPKDAEPEPNNRANDSESSETASKEGVPPAPEEKSLFCSASPDGVDVNVLKSWRVPLAKRAELLSKWQYWHKRGRHDICQTFFRFYEELTVRKFPYKEAEINLKVDIRATEFHDEVLHKAVDLRRSLRPWEHSKSYQVYMKEVEEMLMAAYKCNPRHFNDIENILKQLRKAVLISMDTEEYDGLLKIEENPLFEILEWHCFDVYHFFWTLKHDLETMRSLDLRVMRVESNQTRGKTIKKERIILQKKIADSIKELQRAIDTALREKVYLMSRCHLCIPDAKPETNS